MTPEELEDDMPIRIVDEPESEFMEFPAKSTLTGPPVIIEDEPTLQVPDKPTPAVVEEVVVKPKTDYESAMARLDEVDEMGLSLEQQADKVASLPFTEGERNALVKEARPAAAVTFQLPTDFRDKYSSISTAKDSINQELARRTTDIISRYPKRLQQQAMLVEKVNADSALSALKTQEDALNATVYNKLTPELRYKADRLSEQYGMNVAQASDLAIKDSNVRTISQTILAKFAGDPQRQSQIESALFGDFARDPNTGKAIIGPDGRAQRDQTKGLLSVGDLGTLQPKNQQVFERFAMEMGIDPSTGNYLTGANKAPEDPVEKELADDVKRFDAQVGMFKEDESLAGRESFAQGQQGRLEAVRRLNQYRAQKTGNYSTPDELQSRATERARVEGNIGRVDSINKGLEKVTTGYEGLEKVEKSNEYLRSEAKKDNKPIIKAMDEEYAKVKLFDKPPGVYYVEEETPGTINPIKTVVWEGVDKWAKDTILPEQQLKQLSDRMADEESLIKTLLPSIKSQGIPFEFDNRGLIKMDTDPRKLTAAEVGYLGRGGLQVPSSPRVIPEGVKRKVELYNESVLKRLRADRAINLDQEARKYVNRK